jgi:hypothetical protein
MKKLALILVTLFTIVSCNIETSQQKSDSGVQKATTKVATDMNGRTVEQENIIKRLERDNKVGSIKHLYIISAYTGDVLQYSTVKGKVTSGGKRLSPKTVNGIGYNNPGVSNFVDIGGYRYTTDEVLDDGGAYGESGNYLYWFDAQDNYQQYYPSGGTYLHISDKPLRIKKTNFSVSIE